jgi:hypothetical protein
MRSVVMTSRLVIEMIYGIVWQEFGWGGSDEPGPQTESSIERGFRLPGPVDDEWGRSESFDPDNVGDIADEGPGHRG